MNRHLLTALVALACVLVLVPAAQAASTYASAISSTPGLMSFWRLSEQGVQADAEGMTATDATDADPGTYHLGVNLGAPGALEGDPTTAAHFGSPDGYVSIPPPSLPGSGQFTIEGWVNLDAAANNVSVVGDGAQVTQHTGFLVDTQSFFGHPALDFVFGDGTSNHLINGQVYTPRAWYYFAATYDGSTVRWYLNGALAGSSAASIQAATGPLLIASNPVIAGSGQLAGSVGDVALYNGPLSAAVIQQHYQLGITDGSTPTTSLSGTPPALTNQPSATFQFSSASVTPTFQCQLDGGVWQTCASPDTVTGLSDGQHRFSVRAVNRAGQADPAPPSAAWTVQTAPPTTSVDAGPAALTASTIATFSFTSPTGLSYRCQLDAQPPVACISPYTVAGVLDGSHTFSVYATDGAGNVASAPAQYSWSVDTVAPTAFILQGPSTENPSLPFEFAATKSSVTYLCSLDGGAWSECGSPLAAIPHSVGTHTLRVYARDSLDNLEPAPTSYSWTVVAAQPTPAPAPAPELNLSVTLPARITSAHTRAHELAVESKQCHRQPRCLARLRTALTPRFSYRVSAPSQVVVVVGGPHGTRARVRLSLKSPGGSFALPSQFLAALKRPGRYTAVFHATAGGITASRTVAFTVRS